MIDAVAKRNSILNELSVYEITQWYGYEIDNGAYIVQDSTWTHAYIIERMGEDRYIMYTLHEGSYIWKNIQSPAWHNEHKRRSNIVERMNTAVLNGCMCINGICNLHNPLRLDLRHDIMMLKLASGIEQPYDMSSESPDPIRPDFV